MGQARSNNYSYKCNFSSWLPFLGGIARLAKRNSPFLLVMSKLTATRGTWRKESRNCLFDILLAMNN